jgi:hypothetical protein
LGADPPAKLGGGVVEAVDAALGFVAGQRRVARRLGVALIEGVRDVARDVDGEERMENLIETALAECDEDPMRASRLTDLLLDVRNAAGDSAAKRAARA